MTNPTLHVKGPEGRRSIPMLLEAEMLAGLPPIHPTLSCEGRGVPRYKQLLNKYEIYAYSLTLSAAAPNH